MGGSDHKALRVDFELPAFDNDGLQSRCYCPAEILRDQEATEELEHCLREIQSTGTQWWEDALPCIKLVAMEFNKDCTVKKKSIELTSLRLLQDSTREEVSLETYAFLSSLGLEAGDSQTAYSLLVGVYEKAQRDITGMETISELKGVIPSGALP